MVTCRLLRHRKRERREALRCPHHLILLPSVTKKKNNNKEGSGKHERRWVGWRVVLEPVQLFLINAIRLEGYRCSGTKCKSPGGIIKSRTKLSKMPSKLTTNRTETAPQRQHNSTQLHGPKGTGRTRFRCSAGQDFPTTPASSPNFPVSQPIRCKRARPAKSINLKNTYAFVDIFAARQHHPPPPTCQPIEINNQQIFA